jgi:hypothetical protein
MAGMKEKILF